MLIHNLMPWIPTKIIVIWRKEVKGIFGIKFLFYWKTTHSSTLTLTLSLTFSAVNLFGALLMSKAALTLDDLFTSTNSSAVI